MRVATSRQSRNHRDPPRIANEVTIGMQPPKGQRGRCIIDRMGTGQPGTPAGLPGGALARLCLALTCALGGCSHRAAPSGSGTPPGAGTGRVPPASDGLSTGHSGPISALSYSADASRLATASEDKSVEIWRVEDKQRERRLAGHSAPPLLLAFAPDNRFLLSRSAPEVILWDLATGAESARWPASPTAPVPFAFRGDGDRLALGLDGAKSIAIIDTSNGASACRLRSDSEFTGALFAAAATDVLFTSNTKGELKRWDLRQCGTSMPVAIPAYGQHAFTRSKDGKLAAIAGLEVIRLFDQESGQVVQSLPIGGGVNIVRNLRFAGEGYLLANRVRITDGKKIERSLGDTVLWAYGDDPRSGAIVWQMAGVWAADADPTRQVLAVADGTRVRWLPFPKPERQTPALVVQSGHTRPVQDAAFSPSGTLLATCDGLSVALWDMRSRRMLRRMQFAATKVAFADGGAYVVAGGVGVRVWETDSGRLVDVLAVGQMVTELSGNPRTPQVAIHTDRQLALHHLRTRHVAGPVPTVSWVSAFDGSGDRFAFVDGTGQLLVIDTSTGKPLLTLPGGTFTEALALSADGSVLAAAGPPAVGEQSQVLAWRTDTGVRLFSSANRAQSLFFRGDRIYGLSGGEIRAWRSKDGAEVAELKRVGFDRSGGWQTPQSMAMSANSELIAIGQSNGDVSLWSPDLAARGALRRHVHTIHAVAASPTGAAAVVVDGGGNLVRWDPNDADVVKLLAKTPFVHPRAVAWSPSGKWVATGELNKPLLRSAQTGMVDRTLAPLEVEFDGESSFLHWLSFSSDSKRLMAANWFRADVRDVASDKTIVSVDAKALGLSKSEAILSAAMSGDGNTLVLGVGESPLNFSREAHPGRVVVWDIARDRQRHRLTGHVDRISAVAIDPSGSVVASVDRRGNLFLWKAKSGRTLADSMVGMVQDLEFSPDGKRLVTGGADGLVTLWDVGKQRALLQTRIDSPVAALRFSPDGDRLWIGSEDGVTAIVRAADGKLLAQLALPDDGGHVTFTPDGFYWASQSALDAVGFRVGDRVLAFDQLDLYFHRPDIVLERLGAADPDLRRAFEAAHQRRLRKLDARELGAVPWAEVPTVQVTRHEVERAGATARFRADIEGRGVRGLARLDVWVNGVPAYAMGGKPLDGKPDASIAIDVPLLEGANEVQLSVTDVAGLESFREVFSIDNRRQKRPERQLYILAVGVSGYGDSQYNLRYANKDARNFADLFAEVGQFETVHKLVLTDQQATKEAILRKGKALLAAAGLEDTVVVFFAGHGLRDKSLTYYFAAHDTSFLNPTAGGLSFADIESLVDGVSARRRVIFIDSCYAGEVDPQAAPPPRRRTVGAIAIDTKRPRGLQGTSSTTLSGVNHRRSLDVDFASLRRGTGAAIIASSSGYEVAFESPEWKNGAFTFSLLEGIRARKADMDGDAVITVSELRNYVGHRVRELTGGLQGPVARHQNVLLDFDVAAAQDPFESLDFDYETSWRTIAVGREAAFVARGNKDGTIEIWDRDKRRVTRTLRGTAADDGLLKVSPSGRYLVQSSKEANTLFDLRTGRSQSLGDGATYFPWAAFAPDEKQLAVHRGRELAIVEVANGAVGRQIPAFYSHLYAFESPTQLVAIGGDEIVSYSASTGKKQTLAAKAGPFSLQTALSGDGTVVATWSENTLTLWRSANGALIRTIDVGAAIEKTALSPDGKQALVSTFDGRLRLWRVADGQELTWLRSPTNMGVGNIGFSPEGRFVFANSGMKIWLWRL